ncbi:MAG TPA: transglycosylase SLT domain-containing protein [Solirubrobacteraceae bacterium]
MRSQRLPVLLAGLAAAIVVVTLVASGGGGPSGPPPPALLHSTGLPAHDPLAWSPSRSADDARRATAGLSHVLYAKVPAGIVASAERTAHWRPLVERAAGAHGGDPNTLEAIVLLESAGNPEAQASNDLHGAVGLTQILAETGRDLLGMHVDVTRSARLTRRILRAEARGQHARAQALRRQRTAVDERFDPRKALDAAARYLAIARQRLGADDLAIVGYHMGIGNLQTALARYGAGRVPYARLFFDSTPGSHAAAWRLLSSLGDDSSTYLFREQAARAVMGQWRSDPGQLAAQAKLQTARASAEEVLHPPDATKAFSDPGALKNAYASGDVVPLPAAYLTAHGVAIDHGMGSLAAKVGQKPALYRGLRREALATIAYIGANVRAIAGTRAPLVVTSTVRDAKYQKALAATDLEAVRSYSLHTTGFTFDISRRYASGAQAHAFQFELDRLTALNLIAWVREPAAIHVTVSSDAAMLERPMGVRPA